MDPVTFVISALVAGAASSLEETATSAARRAYRKLKELVSARLAGTRGRAALELHESDPRAPTGELTEVLTASGAAYEETVLAAAKDLMALIDPAGTAAGKYVVDLGVAQGVQMGDGNTQANTFGQPAGTPGPDRRLMVSGPGHGGDPRQGQGVQIGAGGQQFNTWVGSFSASVEWPVQVGRPPARPRAFQPREALAAEIVGKLRQGSAVLSQVVAAGGGGVGKTQLVAATFARERDEGVELLVWVNASSRESILTTYTQARRAIEPGAVIGMSAEDVAADFLGWLGTTSRSWLVVLDDVADPADLRGLWPEGRSGRVLATTRRRDLAPANAAQVLVGVFTPGEALGYLVERLADSPAHPVHPQVLDEAADLAEDLGWLPVALAQAAAVILNQGITCAEYRRRFSDRAGSLDRLFPQDASADEYAHTVATTWSLAIERADRLSPSGLARPVLQIAAVVDPNGAPDTLWDTAPVRRFLDGRLGGETATDTSSPDAIELAGPGAAVVDQAHAALRNLHRLSLLTHEPWGGALAVRTHALIQRATIETLSAPRREEVIRVAADALAEIWPSTENDPDHSRVLRKNAATLAERAGDALWGSGGHEVLFRAGKSLGELGMVHEAIDYWAAMADTATRLLGPDHPRTLTTRHSMADWRGVAGDATGAAQALERLLRDQLRVLGPDHRDTLVTRQGLAHWRGAAGDAKGAVRAFEELLSNQLRVLGPDHPDTLTTRHDLADWRGAAGDAKGAAQAFEELLPDQLRELGPDHPFTLSTRHGLADWRGAVGDAAGTVSALEGVLGDQLRVLGPNHPDTLGARSHLADWRGVAGDAAGAADAFVGLAADRLRVLGPNHPDTLAARSHLARWRGAAGDAAGAAQMLRELIDEQLRVLSPDHPDVLTFRHDLGYWTGAAGDVAGAVHVCEELVGDRLRVLGPDHPHTLSTRCHLAHWTGAAGDAAGAARAFDEVLPDRLRVQGADHPDTLATRCHQIHWRGTAGAAAGAVTAFEDLLGDALRVLGPDHPHTLATRHGLAYWRGAAGDVTGAVTACTELLGDRLRLQGPDHPHTLAIRGHLAYWTGVAGDVAGAVRAFGELLPDRLRVLGPDHPHTLATRGHLAHWTGVAGDAAGAVHAYEEVLGDQVRVLSPNHPDTLATGHGLTYWRGHDGNAAGAAHTFGEPRSDQLRVLGTDCPHPLATRHGMADWRAGRMRRW